MPKKRLFEKRAIIFLIKFFAIYLILQALILLAPLNWLKNSIASFQAGLLGLEAIENIIVLQGHRFEIVANCTGLMGISVLAAIIFSLKSPEMKKKVALFALGALVLFPVNLLRVYLVLLAATIWGAGIAEWLHTLTWFGVSAAILILWYYLTKKIAGKKEFSNML